MARGGKRPGAGRPKGCPNKVTERQRERQLKAVEKGGQTPLAYMLEVMRDPDVPREERLDAAHKAAPYVHAKLSNVDHKSSDGSMSPKPDRIEIVAPSGDGQG